MALKITLRDYQMDAANEAIIGFENAIEGIGGPYGKQLLVEPTGSGKTVIFSALADYCVSYWKKPALVLVDQIDLADQALEEIIATTELYPQIEQAERRASADAPVIIASVQTMANRLDKFAPDKFGMVIADEADRSVSDQWQKVLRHFDPHAKILGVTATPDRQDQRNVLDYYERIAHETGLFDLIKQGYLSKIMVQTCPLQIDITGVKQTQGDYDKEQLDAVLTPYFDEVCEAIQTYASDRKILVFLPLIETSKKFVRVAENHGIAAEHIDGAMSSRKEVQARFRNRETTLLSNAMLLGRGYNDRSIDCIVNLRPTRSATLYRQFVGRGTRTYCPHGCPTRCEHRDAKQDLLLLDFIWSFHKHGLQRPANLVATSAEHAKKLTDYSVRASGKQLDLEGIDSKVAMEAEKALLRQLQESRKLRHGLFDAMDFAVTFHQRDLMDYTPRAKWEMRPVSEGQAAFLKKVGFDAETVKTFGQAHMILDAVTKRRDQGLATLKQVRLMERYGMPHASKVTFAGAKAWLDWRLNGVAMPEGLELYTSNPEHKVAPDDQRAGDPKEEPPAPPASAPIRGFVDAEKPRLKTEERLTIINPDARRTPDYKDEFARMKKAIQGNLGI